MQRIEKEGKIETDYRLGKSREYYENTAYTWVPEKCKNSTLCLSYSTL